jgi:hypothetical protein
MGFKSLSEVSKELIDGSDDEDSVESVSEKKIAPNPNKGTPVKTDVKEVKECKHCLQTACFLDQKVDSLDSNTDLFNYLMDQGDSMKEDGLTNKEIRLALYKTVTRFIHDFLGKGNRCPLPLCVSGEIKDAFHEPGGNHTGFKKGFLK